MRTPFLLPPASRFTPDLVPSAIYRRNLNQYSVHYSPITFQWIATITRATDGYNAKSNLQFSFSSEREAKKFCKSYTPPKRMPPTPTCFICTVPYSKSKTPCHCRNCGVCICDSCSTRWGIQMVPKTYTSHSRSITVRVCKSCDWLSNAFCISLLQGNNAYALQLFETGNVNLRSFFADIHKEAMLPIHCAVMGGSLTLVKWLVESHACPLSVKIDIKTGRLMSIQTSSGRSLIDLAIAGKPKLDILRYLILEKDLSVLDAKDSTLASRCLETLLRSEASMSCEAGNPNQIEPDNISVADSVATKDACLLCCEQPLDCVLTPCGHQICCQDCGTNLTTCPICKMNCQVLRIFRR